MSTYQAIYYERSEDSACEGENADIFTGEDGICQINLKPYE